MTNNLCIYVLYQTRRAEFQGSGLAGTFRKIFQTEGVVGFYRYNFLFNVVSLFQGTDLVFWVKNLKCYSI